MTIHDELTSKGVRCYRLDPPAPMATWTKRWRVYTMEHYYDYPPMWIPSLPTEEVTRAHVKLNRTWPLPKVAGSGFRMSEPFNDDPNAHQNRLDDFYARSRR